MDNHRRFLSFLEQRVGSRADAEDILQSAFVRAIERGGQLRNAESAVAWFYRLLRSALADYYRHSDAGRRALEAAAQEAAAGPDDPALRDEVCRCVLALLDNLKPEYASLIREVDLEHVAVGAAAKARGISENNASVRLHRARKALLREVQRSCGTCATHGCLDCECGAPGHRGTGGKRGTGCKDSEAQASAVENRLTRRK